MINLSDAISKNGFYDATTPSRWKTLITDFSAQNGTTPDLLNIEELILIVLRLY